MPSNAQWVGVVVMFVLLVSFVAWKPFGENDEDDELLDSVWVEAMQGEEKIRDMPVNVVAEEEEDGGFCLAPDTTREEEMEQEIVRLQLQVGELELRLFEEIEKASEKQGEAQACDNPSHTIVPAPIVIQSGSCKEAADVGQIFSVTDGHQRVLMPSFPSSGGPELREVLSRTLEVPSCSVYPEEGGSKWNERLGIEDGDIVQCECPGTAGQADIEYECGVYGGAPATIATHFPAVTQQQAIPTVDKVLMMVRNPIDNIESFWRMCKETKWLASRRRAWRWHLEQELGQYQKFHDFWRRYAESMDLMFMAVKYEDFCENRRATLDKIYAFLDVPTDQIHYDRIDTVVLDDFCFSFDETENGVHRYTEGQGGKVQRGLNAILRGYDYTQLIEEYAVYWEGVPDEV